MVIQVLCIKQAKHRIQCFSEIFQNGTSKLRIWNIISLAILDVAIGFVVSLYLISAYPDLFALLITKVEYLLTVVLDLLQWLRGSPAGLKLNAALNSLLCRFFSYHLHLWRNYLGIIEPVLSTLLSIVTYAGFLGLTVQISLLKDTLSIATFHIYCLYIYATRLFNVQSKTIISLGRLFFGKKWNPLRNRVDSVHLSISEMFLGSLGFTIAIFLFPTTILYYAVFLGLRLPVRLMEYILRSAVDMINSMELITAGLIWMNSPIVADDIFFQPFFEEVDGKSVVTFEIRTFSTRKVVSLPSVGASFKQTLREICQGVVIQE
ncbi:unnamed protein product [Allacma fusca]|uniref:Uncharacterized protein n=1 Tax=Allacma fusca TaxID=39272 RepID=A0A8J2M671_9HEXA|nr:unnamed protein product [Allacma fusca]